MMQRALVRVLCVALMLVTVTSFSTLLSRTLEMNGYAWGAVWADFRPALQVTHFGRIWRWRIPALVVLWLGWGWSRHGNGHPRANWIMALALAAIVLTRSDTGHPADQGDFTADVWVDWLHMLAAGTWVGSLFGMSLVVYPRLLHVRDHALVPAAAIFRRLSTLSGIALAVVVAAGIYSAIQLLGGFAGLWTSRFGIILDVKVAIVIGMIGFGAHNRYIKLPRLLRRASGGIQPRGDATGGPSASGRAGIVRSCARAVLVESVLGIAVIGAAACLIHAMPPADVHHMSGDFSHASTAVESHDAVHVPCWRGNASGMDSGVA